MRVQTICLLASLTCSAAHADSSEPVLRTELSPRCALEVDIRRDERPACWRLDCVDAAPKELGCDLTAMHQVAEVTIAPDQQWMAVVSVGEGHPFVETVALPDFLAGKPYAALCTINPYPGTLGIDGWEPDSLRLLSDVDLMLTQGRDLDAGLERHFRLNLRDCALTPAG